MAPAVGSPAARPVDPRGVQIVPAMLGVVYVVLSWLSSRALYDERGAVIHHSSLDSLVLGLKATLCLGSELLNSESS